MLIQAAFRLGAFIGGILLSQCCKAVFRCFAVLPFLVDTLCLSLGICLCCLFSLCLGSLCCSLSLFINFLAFSSCFGLGRFYLFRLDQDVADISCDDVVKITILEQDDIVSISGRILDDLTVAGASGIVKEPVSHCCAGYAAVGGICKCSLGLCICSVALCCSFKGSSVLNLSLHGLCLSLCLSHSCLNLCFIVLGFSLSLGFSFCLCCAFCLCSRLCCCLSFCSFSLCYFSLRLGLRFRDVGFDLAGHIVYTVEIFFMFIIVGLNLISCDPGSCVSLNTLIISA